MVSLVAFTRLYAFLVRVRTEVEQTEVALSLQGGELAGAPA